LSIFPAARLPTRSFPRQLQRGDPANGGPVTIVLNS
jgi:hypothetical protein